MALPCQDCFLFYHIVPSESTIVFHPEHLQNSSGTTGFQRCRKIYWWIRLRVDRKPYHLPAYVRGGIGFFPNRRASRIDEGGILFRHSCSLGTRIVWPDNDQVVGKYRLHVLHHAAKKHLFHHSVTVGADNNEGLMGDIVQSFPK